MKNAYRAGFPSFLALSIAALPAVSQSLHTHWIKLDGWDMGSSATRSYGLSGILPANIVAAICVVHSNPVTVNGQPGKIEVERLDQGSWGEARNPFPSEYMGRGGFLTIRHQYSDILAFRGPSNGPYQIGTWAANRFQRGLHTGSANRGWIKVDYTGSPINASQPYAVKTKVLSIDNWDMTATFRKTIDLANFGYPANRVMSFIATIISDAGTEATDIIRFGAASRHGGVAVLTDKVVPPAAVLKVDDAQYMTFPSGETGYASMTYFNNGPKAYDFNEPNGRRGYLKIDYLAAQCGEGSGYSRNFINVSGQNGYDCHGNFAPPGASGNAAAVHVVQTRGVDIWGTSDKFAFINKSQTAATANYTVRVDRQENTDSWARAGLMVRASNTTSGSGSRHVALYVTPGNGICFTSRYRDGETTTHTCTGNDKKAPYWLQIRKSSGNYTGWISTDGSSWNQVGQTRSVSPAMPATYFVGLAQSAGNNGVSLLNTSVYSNASF